MDRIGTIEILRQRIYPLVAGADNGQSVIVEPGTFDLYRDGDETFWIMSGRRNRPVKPTLENLGGGMFLGRGGGDVPTGPQVSFSSKRFSPGEWADLLTEPNFTEGHAEQRLRVTLTAAETGK